MNDLRNDPRTCAAHEHKHKHSHSHYKGRGVQRNVAPKFFGIWSNDMKHSNEIWIHVWSGSWLHNDYEADDLFWGSFHFIQKIVFHVCSYLK